MLRVEITPQMRLKMKARHAEAGNAYKGASIQGGKGRIWGILGEEVVLSALPGAISCNTSDYDIIFRRATLDVKTKTRKDIPELRYDATVDQSAKHQNPNAYMFVSIVAPQSLMKETEQYILNYEYKEAYIMGFLDRQSFYAKARYFNSGDVDPSNGLKYRENIYLVKYDQLMPLSLLFNLPQGVEHVHSMC